MKAVPMHPLGVEVTGCPPLSGLDPDTVGELRGLLARHGVVVLPGQDIDDAGFVAFLARFGRLTFTKGETPVAGHPDLNVVSNVGRTTPPRSTFHVDTSYVRDPPAYTALRAVAIPAAGGETLFTDQYAAYDTLDPGLRARLAGRTITHVATGVELDPGDEAVAEHPVFRRHPVSGRISLYLSTPKRCASVSGMGPEESAEVVRALYDHSTREANTHRHRWAPGDVVMWDNRCVLHRADHAGVVGDRVMHRGMVAA
jgi:taurine dioxygenase